MKIQITLATLATIAAISPKAHASQELFIPDNDFSNDRWHSETPTPYKPIKTSLDEHHRLCNDRHLTKAIQLSRKKGLEDEQIARIYFQLFFVRHGYYPSPIADQFVTNEIKNMEIEDLINTALSTAEQAK